MWTALFLVTLAAAICFCALAVLLDAESRLLTLSERLTVLASGMRNR